MTQAEIYQAVSPKLPKNFPFYNWVPKPLGIAFLVILFIPIMTCLLYTSDAADE